jgi:hypothetical protein
MTSRAPHGELSPIAQEVLRKRVLFSDGHGNSLETWEVAKMERQFSRSADVRETAESFFSMMQALDFLPTPKSETTLRLTAEVVQNLSAASGVAYKKLGAILTSLAAPIRHAKGVGDHHKIIKVVGSNRRSGKSSSKDSP